MNKKNIFNFLLKVSQVVLCWGGAGGRGRVRPAEGRRGHPRPKNVRYRCRMESVLAASEGGVLAGLHGLGLAPLGPEQCDELLLAQTCQVCAPNERLCLLGPELIKLFLGRIYSELESTN